MAAAAWRWPALSTEMLDRHLDVDLRAMFLTIRASLGMLTAAGAEHGKALVVNVSSLAAKGGTPGCPSMRPRRRASTR